MFITDEEKLYREVKKASKSMFLQFEAGNNSLILKSHSGTLFTHYAKGIGSLACMGKECFFCKNNNRKRREIYYWAEVNGKEGIIRLPIMVFLAILDLTKSEAFEKVKTPRQAQWLVVKTGEGTKTRYSVSFAGAIEENEKEIKENTEKLKEFLEKLWQKLKEKYEDNVASDYGKGEENEEEINPDDIPF